MNPLDVALAYARGGAEVLPLHTPTPEGCSCRRADCASVGKHPRTRRGKDDATSDPETVRSWWDMWPTANIGIRPAEGLAVLDVDPRNGGAVQLAAMQDRYGALPVTRLASTGGGGVHLWYVCRGPVRGSLAPGVDVKAHAGYVVVPPSVHASGSRYAWGLDVPVAPAPAYLRRLLAPPEVRTPRSGGASVTPAVVAGLVRTVARSSEGGRNRALYWAARRAVAKGIDVNPLIDAALAVGLSRAEVERTVASAAAGGGAR